MYRWTGKFYWSDIRLDHCFPFFFFLFLFLFGAFGRKKKFLDILLVIYFNQYIMLDKKGCWNFFWVDLLIYWDYSGEEFIRWWSGWHMSSFSRVIGIWWPLRNTEELFLFILQILDIFFKSFFKKLHQKFLQELPPKLLQKLLKNLH